MHATFAASTRFTDKHQDTKKKDSKGFDIKALHQEVASQGVTSPGCRGAYTSALTAAFNRSKMLAATSMWQCICIITCIQASSTDCVCMVGSTRLGRLSIRG